MIKYGKKAKWTDIAKLIPLKSESMCHQRWFTYLEAHIKKRPTLSKEDRDAMDREDQNLYDHRTKHHGVITMNRVTDVSIDSNGKVKLDVKHSNISDHVLIVSNEVLLKLHLPTMPVVMRGFSDTL